MKILPWGIMVVIIRHVEAGVLAPLALLLALTGCAIWYLWALIAIVLILLAVLIITVDIIRLIRQENHNDCN